MPTGPKVDPFKPQQPQIPGVPASAKSANNYVASERPATAPQRSAASSLQARSASNWLRIGLAAGIVIVIVGVGWWVRVSSANPAKEPANVSASAADSDLASSAKALPVGPGEIATGSELERAWSSQRFIFRDAASSETIPALAVRLPGGDLWGISLREPYGTCDLEYVTNLETLRSQYGLRATHPMVVDSCAARWFAGQRFARLSPLRSNSTAIASLLSAWRIPASLLLAPSFEGGCRIAARFVKLCANRT